jgi:acyl phosphate:glycerol-3-phosphate acyltransferase
VNGVGFAAWCLASYAIGSISFALVITKQVAGIDLRQVGSGNLGATNAGRVLGRRWAIVIYVLDGLKGATAVLAPRLLFGSAAAWGGVPIDIAAGFCVMLGHIFPFYLRFKGGKGVATGSGVVCSLAPLAFVAAFVVWFLTVRATRMVSAGSVVAALALPFLVAWLGRDRRHYEWTVGFCAVLAALVVFMHRKNIQRMLAGTESKVAPKKEVVR